MKKCKEVLAKKLLKHEKEEGEMHKKMAKSHAKLGSKPGMMKKSGRGK